MNRRTLLSSLLALGITPSVIASSTQTNTTRGTGMKNETAAHTQSPNGFAKINSLESLKDLPDTQKMPVLFLGHGSPMYAITDTEFGRGFQKLAKKLPKPTAILCISAHWLSQGPWVTAMQKPRTIHDFGGFPKALHEFQYPASGSPALAKATHDLVNHAQQPAHLDHTEWGLDHGTWSVLTHLYPEADIPVVQLSLDYFRTPEAHYRLAQQLSVLRRKGVLVVGSGNVVHNLRLSGADDDYTAFDWAIETDEKIKRFITSGDHASLIHYDKSLGKAGALSIPTNEHYLPLLYALALQDKKDSLTIFNDKAINGAISMTSVAIGV